MKLCFDLQGTSEENRNDYQLCNRSPAQGIALSHLHSVKTRFVAHSAFYPIGARWFIPMDNTAVASS
jgi:hypothetical protein